MFAGRSGISSRTSPVGPWRWPPSVLLFFAKDCVMAQTRRTEQTKKSSAFGWMEGKRIVRCSKRKFGERTFANPPKRVRKPLNMKWTNTLCCNSNPQHNKHTFVGFAHFLLISLPGLLGFLNVATLSHGGCIVLLRAGCSERKEKKKRNGEICLQWDGGVSGTNFREEQNRSTGQELKSN